MNLIKTQIILKVLLVLITCFSCAQIGKEIINKNYLLGSWTSNPNDNIDFIITAKNIQYFEDIENGINCLGTYKINKKLFTPFDCSGRPIANYEIIYLTQDSMRWRTENGNILEFIKKNN